MSCMCWSCYRVRTHSEDWIVKRTDGTYERARESKVCTYTAGKSKILRLPLTYNPYKYFAYYENAELNGLGFGY